jgi:hypothetical protein
MLATHTLPLAQGLPGMGLDLVGAALLLIAPALFLIIFPLVRLGRARKRRQPVPRWLLSWLIGLGVGIISTVLISVMRASLFIRYLFWYWKGWNPLLPVSILSPLGMILTFDFFTILGGLICFCILLLISPKRA